MNSPVPSSDSPSGINSSRRRQLLILIIISGAILLFIAVVILVYLGLRGAGETPTEPTLTPTVLVEPTATAPAQASTSPVPSCETIISSGDSEVSVALPVSLSLGGAVYPVEPIVPQDDAWAHPEDRPGTSVWVCGTIINYVVGLPPTPANQELISNLAPALVRMLT